MAHKLSTVLVSAGVHFREYAHVVSDDDTLSVPPPAIAWETETHEPWELQQVFMEGGKCHSVWRRNVNERSGRSPTPVAVESASLLSRLNPF